MQISEPARLRIELDASDPARQWCAPDEQSFWILTRDPDQRLIVCDAREPKQRPLRLELDGREVRRRAKDGRKSLLARALGYKGGDYTVLDMTAGLGRDMATCALVGMQVVAFERQPLMFALLQDAWEHCEAGLKARIDLRFGSATAADWNAVDAVLYDPMYPQDGKRTGAAPALELQRMRALVGTDDDVENCFAALRAEPPQRLAIKRPPRGARVELGSPDVDMHGGRVHWAVYLGPAPPAKPPQP